MAGSAVSLFLLCNPHLLPDSVLQEQLTRQFRLLLPASAERSLLISLFARHVAPQPRRQRDRRPRPGGWTGAGAGTKPPQDQQRLLEEIKMEESTPKRVSAVEQRTKRPHEEGGEPTKQPSKRAKITWP